MWSKLKVRVISALIGAVFVIGVTFASTVIFHAVVAALCFCALYELSTVFKKGNNLHVMLPTYIFAICLLSLPFIAEDVRQMLTVFLLIVYVMLLMQCAIFWHDKVKFSDVILSLFMLVYGVLFPVHLTYVRMQEYGLALIFLCFLGAWMPDTFAYFSGKLLGRHKLIPAVSPNKTVEGSIGAIVGCVLIFLVYGLVVSFGFGYGVRYLPLLILALLCGVFAQFGDLAASVIKRECQAKDFGNLIPGHGGILDRVDSLLFVTPLVYYFVQIFEVIYK